MDINTTLQDFINKSDDNNQAVDLDNVVKNIFVTCDTENIGSVQISRIIDFIEPFLQQNIEAIQHLKSCLATNNENPAIDMETFCNNMRVWAEKITSANRKKNFELVEMSPHMDSEKSTGYFQCEHDSPRAVWDTTILNLPEYSTETHEFCISQQSTLENQIQELVHQRNQMKEDTARMRSELNGCMEQNESLQGSFDKLLKKLTNEQKLNASLQMERKKDEELQEELALAGKQIIKLEKSISTLEKQINQLRQHLELSQSEKQGLELKIQYMDKKFEENALDTRILQSEIDLKQQKLISEHEANVSLIKHNQELQDVIEGCNINLEKLKMEKESLEKLLRQQLEKSRSLVSLNKTSDSINSTLQTNIDLVEDEPSSPDMKSDDSIDEQFYYNFHMMFLNTSAVTSNLRDEMTKAATYNIDENDRNENHQCPCYKKFDGSELEKELLTLKRELAQHKNCEMIIDKQKEEIECMFKENCNTKEHLEAITASFTNLKTELLLCQDKEQILLKRCRNLEDSLKSNSDFVADIQLKLSEYTDMENKCKDLTRKIEELETDNSMKYVKIVNLTVEIEKLRQILARTEQQNQEELKKKINQLDEERSLNEKEKNKLLKQIEALNDEKNVLQNEKQQLLTEIIELENRRSQLQTDKDELWNAHENLQAENSKIKSKRDIINSELAKIQNEKDSLQMERDLLNSEYIDLELAKDELESRLRSHIENLKVKVEQMENEKKSLLADICTLTHNTKELEIDIATYKSEYSFNLKLKAQVEELSSILEKMREEHEAITNQYTELKMKAEEERSTMKELTEDYAKVNKEIICLRNKNIELSNKNNSTEKELLEYRQRNDCYFEINQELDKFKNKLIYENKELISKIDKKETSMKKMDINNKQLGIDLINLKLTFDNMKSTMKMYEELSETLHTDNRTLENLVEEQNQVIHRKEIDLTKLRDLCQNYENNIKILETNLQVTQTDQANLKNLSKDKDEVIVQLEEKLNKSIQNNENMKEHINELQRKLDENNILYNEQKQTEIRLQLDIEKMSKTLRLEKEKQSYLKKEITDLGKKISEEKNLGKSCMEDYERAISETDKLKGTIRKLENRNAFIEKQNDILDKEKNNLKNISDENNNKLATLVRCKNELTDKNKKLSEENIEFRRKCDNLTEEVLKKTQSLDEANKKVSQLLNDLHNTEERICDNERRRLGFLKNEINRNKEENEKVKRENDRLCRELDLMTGKIKLLEKDIAAKKHCLEELMIEKDQWLTEKINTCKNSNNTTRNKTRTGFDRLVKKNMKLDDKIIILEEQLSTERKKYMEESKELEIMKEQETRVKNEVKRIKDELHTAINNNDDLIKEVEQLLGKVTNLRKENESLKNKNDQLNKVNETLIHEKEKLKEFSLKEQKLPLKSNQEENSEVNDVEDPCNLRELQTQIKTSAESYIGLIRDRLCERRLRLRRATLHAMSIWKPYLEETDFISTPSKTGFQPQHLEHPIAGPLDEEMLQIEYQIQVTTSLLDRLAYYKNHELLRRSVLYPDFQDSVEQETSPSVNIDVLENLGLSGDLVRVNNFSAVEMEEKFTALVLAYTIDSSSLHQRYSRQKNRLRERENALGEEISMLSIHLEEHANCLDVLPRLERILSLCTQISISAEQFGSLTQQVNLNKAVALMVNYVTHLKQSLDAQQNQYLCIKPSPLKTPVTNEIPLEKRRKWDDIFVIDPLPAETTKKKPWRRETHFMVTLSIAILLMAILFNTFENCNTTFEFSPITPPT